VLKDATPQVKGGIAELEREELELHTRLGGESDGLLARFLTIVSPLA
jgi:hypothetical protein